jgi:pyruvate/2-oxoglutarate dehydrogenase complex dihydrolipoamide acyltransferase (E2) component
MATSAVKLAEIIETLAKKYKFDNDNAIEFLAKQELLPKKMIPKDSVDVDIFASKKAKELAEKYHITPTGEGSGKTGKFTLADIDKMLGKPTKHVLNASPNAIILANENSLSLADIVGTGKDGRILVKDVQQKIDEKDDSDDEEEVKITARARQEAKELDISDEELKTIKGTGKEGTVLLSDVKKHNSSSEGSDED